jgi:hypothetical protein
MAGGRQRGSRSGRAAWQAGCGADIAAFAVNAVKHIGQRHIEATNRIAEVEHA